MIQVQGAYEFDVIGDGEGSEITVSLLTLKTPPAFNEGLLPTGVGSITGRNFTGSQTTFPIQGILDGTELRLSFQGSPTQAVRVTAHMIFTAHIIHTEAVGRRK